MFAALLIMLSGISEVQAQEEPTGFVVDKIIGKVDNYIVLKSELDKAFQEYVSNGGSPSAETRCQFLAMLLRNKLMMAKAEIDSIVVADSEVDANTQRRMEMILAQYGGHRLTWRINLVKRWSRFRWNYVIRYGNKWW